MAVSSSLSTLPPQAGLGIQVAVIGSVKTYDNFIAGR